MKKIDDAANMWNKTRDPQYKKLWYSLIKEFADGKDFNNIDRRNVSSRSGDERNDRRNIISK